jgi:mannose-6-phosphate isomerase-like protein (cupin superfamily)
MQDEQPYKRFQVRPQLLEQGMQSQLLALTPAMRVMWFSIGGQGQGWGETVLHKHPGSDAVWYVLQGEATFYKEGDEVIGKLGKNEGLFIRHDAPYWFQSTSPESLIMLRFGATADAEFGERAEILGERGAVPKRDETGFVEAVGTRVLAERFFGD